MRRKQNWAKNGLFENLAMGYLEFGQDIRI